MGDEGEKQVEIWKVKRVSDGGQLLLCVQRCCRLVLDC
jgi:hypothetical protein